MNTQANPTQDALEQAREALRQAFDAAQREFKATEQPRLDAIKKGEAFDAEQNAIRAEIERLGETDPVRVKMLRQAYEKLNLEAYNHRHYIQAPLCYRHERAYACIQMLDEVLGLFRIYRRV